MPTDSAITTVAKPTARSRITNGKELFLASIDGRSREARRFRDVHAALIQHLGGEDIVSEAQRHLCKRAAALATWCEVEESKLAAENGDLDIGPYVTGVNALRRILADIGLKRTARDVTPSLSSLLADLGNAEDAETVTDAGGAGAAT